MNINGQNYEQYLLDLLKLDLPSDNITSQVGELARYTNPENLVFWVNPMIGDSLQTKTAYRCGFSNLINESEQNPWSKELLFGQARRLYKMRRRLTASFHQKARDTWQLSDQRIQQLLRRFLRASKCRPLVAGSIKQFHTNEAGVDRMNPWQVCKQPDYCPECYTRQLLGTLRKDVKSKSTMDLITEHDCEVKLYTGNISGGVEEAKKLKQNIHNWLRNTLKPSFATVQIRPDYRAMLYKNCPCIRFQLLIGGPDTEPKTPKCLKSADNLTRSDWSSNLDLTRKGLHKYLAFQSSLFTKPVNMKFLLAYQDIASRITSVSNYQRFEGKVCKV